MISGHWLVTGHSVVTTSFGGIVSGSSVDENEALVPQPNTIDLESFTPNAWELLDIALNESSRQLHDLVPIGEPDRPSSSALGTRCMLGYEGHRAFR